MKKLTLSNLKVQSFITTLEKKSESTIKGGTGLYDCGSGGADCDNKGGSLRCIKTSAQ